MIKVVDRFFLSFITRLSSAHRSISTGPSSNATAGLDGGELMVGPLSVTVLVIVVVVSKARAASRSPRHVSGLHPNG